jgi:hypothetical protein
MIIFHTETNCKQIPRGNQQDSRFLLRAPQEDTRVITHGKVGKPAVNETGRVAIS